MALTFDLIYASLKDENAALRKVYTEQQALIRQLVEALDNSSEMVFKDPAKAVLREAAITAARARLEGKRHE